MLIVPIGGGSGASGAALVAKSLRPEITVIGVQAEGASAAYKAWRDRAPRTTERAATFADGLATRTSFDLPQQMLVALLDDFVLVTDDELYAAMRLLLVEGHVVAEGAGAAPDRRRAPHDRTALRQARGVLGQRRQRDRGLAARARSRSIDAPVARATARYHREHDGDLAHTARRHGSPPRRCEGHVPLLMLS